MNNYIYEMDVANLKISYILPKSLICFKIQTTLFNWSPYDRTNLSIGYEAHITDGDFGDKTSYYRCITAESLQSLVETVRQYFIKNPYQQQPVEKSTEDGTESVIQR